MRRQHAALVGVDAAPHTVLHVMLLLVAAGLFGISTGIIMPEVDRDYLIMLPPPLRLTSYWFYRPPSSCDSSPSAVAYCRGTNPSGSQ